MEPSHTHPKPNNLVQTIERVSLLLDMVGKSPKGASIKDLSMELDLPKGTIHRLLSSLSYFGYIRQDTETKNYFLGLKLMELGVMLRDQLDLRKVAEPILRNLAEKTGETAHMVILDMSEVVYIAKMDAPQNTGSLKMVSRMGSRNPPHSCAVGKVLISRFSEEELDNLIGRTGLPQRTPNTIVDPNILRQHLQMVKKQGFAIDDEENELGIRCVAAPVFDGKGRPVAAVSVSGPALRVTKERIRDVLELEVTKAASEISQRLGFTG
jgi:DNA-binding IclR family transcriptional regulator